MGYGIGAVQFSDGELYRPQVVEVNRLEGMKAEEIVYLQLNNTAIASSVLGTVATFSGATLATVPAGFAALTKNDFEVYINGRRVPVQQISSVSQTGTDVSNYAIEVTIDTATFFEQAGAVLETEDEIVLVGKFNT